MFQTFNFMTIRWHVAKNGIRLHQLKHLNLLCFFVYICSFVGIKIRSLPSPAGEKAIEAEKKKRFGQFKKFGRM